MVIISGDLIKLQLQDLMDNVIHLYWFCSQVIRVPDIHIAGNVPGLENLTQQANMYCTKLATLVLVHLRYTKKLIQR